ncbi:non-classical arabinogalactan protein 30 [Populus alba x Populus x berolinensis]|uniref:Non-classical arabinogalactan protein 31-like n=3 Tax=Populus TaxID=3689 RepID=A0A4U5LQ90_POPAL|nr:non-classical arabinogalactan protein 30 [Populus alba]KAG6778757.1 hypothetical protein POTOM_015103 [Populus tomentosa]KAJ6935530.1 non-classical arabinogalactan protein 30 [Populus alba x Populus x berolinensis]KAJ6999829.1 non-classical arabinogalactan protein 30 [Populus alba x Populus x berolinensis]TKR58089.1 hypothetical protein D5086_0000328730 [Populus alba]
MGFVIAKALVPFILSLLCFTVFSENAESLPAEAPHHRGSYHHYPTAAPVSAPPSHAPSKAPTPHHHRRQHHGHAPAPAPVHTPAHAPVYPPKPHIPPPAPAHPPKQSHMPPPAPAHPPKQSHPNPPGFHFPRKLVAVQGVVYCKACNYSGVDTLWGAKPVLGATVKLQCNNTRKPQDVKATTDKNGYFLIKAPKTITSYGVHKCKVWLVSSPNTACSKITNLHGGLTGAILRPEKKPYVDEKKHECALFSVGPFAFEPKCPR